MLTTGEKRYRHGCNAISLIALAMMIFGMTIAFGFGGVFIALGTWLMLRVLPDLNAVTLKEMASGETDEAYRS